MLDKEKLKRKAAELSDVFIEDGNKGAQQYKALYDSGELNVSECYVVCKLVDLYIAIKQGVTSKEDGVIAQRQILGDAVREHERNDCIMERLTFRIETGEAFTDRAYPCEIPLLKSEIGGIAIAKLADYEDAEENGTLIKLPVKAGDIVYVKSPACSHRVDFIHIEDGKCVYCIEQVCDDCNECEMSDKGICVCNNNGYYEFIEEDIGKTVFRTREEAEEALKERESK